MDYTEINVEKQSKTEKNSRKLSLYPLRFEEAVKSLINTRPNNQPQTTVNKDAKV